MYTDMNNNIEMLAKIYERLHQNNKLLNNIYNSLSANIFNDIQKTLSYTIMSMPDTIQKIIDGYSIARYGEGEISLMLLPDKNLSFQKNSLRLRNILQYFFESYDSLQNYLLICIVNINTAISTQWWKNYYMNNFILLKTFLHLTPNIYGDALITRPDFFIKYHNIAVDSWRKVWNNKKICIITGKNSRFVMIPELFDNIKSYTIIESKPINAFDDYDFLIKQLDNNCDDIVLLSLGPTATILAAYLASKEGGQRQAIDIGHISSSYLRVFKGGKNPEALPMIM